jgi:hypothetical protein
MMVLTFILRYTITLMRKMGLASKLPLDHHVYLHKFTGVLIFVQAWLHTIAHLINFGKMRQNASLKREISIELFNKVARPHLRMHLFLH